MIMLALVSWIFFKIVCFVREPRIFLEFLKFEGS